MKERENVQLVIKMAFRVCGKSDKCSLCVWYWI